LQRIVADPHGMRDEQLALMPDVIVAVIACQS
jgi:hypothetical protein